MKVHVKATISNGPLRASSHISRSKVDRSTPSFIGQSEKNWRLRFRGAPDPEVHAFERKVSSSKLLDASDGRARG